MHSRGPPPPNHELPQLLLDLHELLLQLHFRQHQAWAGWRRFCPIAGLHQSQGLPIRPSGTRFASSFLVWYSLSLLACWVAGGAPPLSFWRRPGLKFFLKQYSKRVTPQCGLGLFILTWWLWNDTDAIRWWNGWWHQEVEQVQWWHWVVAPMEQQVRGARHGTINGFALRKPSWIVTWHCCRWPLFVFKP